MVPAGDEKLIYKIGVKKISSFDVPIMFAPKMNPIER